MVSNLRERRGHAGQATCPSLGDAETHWTHNQTRTHSLANLRSPTDGGRKLEKLERTRIFTGRTGEIQAETTRLGFRVGAHPAASMKPWLLRAR